MDNQNMLYLSVDGDGIGQMVGRAVLADDEQALHEVSQRIDAAQDFIKAHVEQLGGQTISFGGDEGVYKIPAEGLDSIETLRKDIEHSFGFTVTVGVGQSLSEAAKSLLAGKASGKDKIVVYSPEVDGELKSMSDRLESGEGSDEDKKLTDAYLTPKEDHMKNSEDHDESTCEYCQEADKKNGKGDTQSEEHSGPDEVGNDDGSTDAPQDGDPSDSDTEGGEADHDHDDDDCEYCQQADSDGQPSADEDAQQDPQDPSSEEEDTSAQDPEQPSDDQSQGDTDELEEQAEEGSEQAQDEHTQDGMKQIASAIEDEDGGQPSDVANMDDEDAAVGTNMEDGVSRPEDYDDAGDHTMGLSEDEADDDQGPDLGAVMKDGLDAHADNIQKEKVSQLVGQALEGFKANKKVLEMAKEQAPDFYASSIAMLKAMIEMSKMLGLGQGDDQSSAPTGDDDGSETEEQAEQSDEQEDGPQPGGAAPDPLATSGGTQPPPKIKGQSAKA